MLRLSLIAAGESKKTLALGRPLVAEDHPAIVIAPGFSPCKIRSRQGLKPKSQLALAARLNRLLKNS